MLGDAVAMDADSPSSAGAPASGAAPRAVSKTRSGHLIVANSDIVR